MESNKSDLPPEISIRELYENAEKEEKRKAVNDYQKKYNARPEVIEQQKKKIKK